MHRMFRGFRLKEKISLHAQQDVEVASRLILSSGSYTKSVILQSPILLTDSKTKPTQNVSCGTDVNVSCEACASVPNQWSVF